MVTLALATEHGRGGAEVAAHRTAHRRDQRGGGVYSEGTLNVSDSTFSGNEANYGGGGISRDDGTLDINNSTLFGNTATYGGAVYNKGMTHLYRTGINNNTAMGTGGLGGAGGGAYNDTTGGLLLRNVTISANMSTAAAAPAGAGVYNAGNLRIEFATIAQNGSDGLHNISAGEYTIRSSIIAYHAAGNCTGPITPSSFGYNVESENTCALIEPSDLVNTDPLLAPLASNGGNSLTHLLNPGSPAIDSGDPSKCTALDQRGVTRPQGGGCDRGAVEMDSSTPTLVPTDTPTPVPTSTPTPEPIPLSINFNADLYLLEEGECTKLHWEVKNAESVFLDGELVDALGARQVCPEQTTTYALMAMSSSGEQEAYVTIEVDMLPEPPDAPAQLGVTDFICDPKLYRVTLQWIDTSDNEAGFKVFRDGTLLATLPANSTSYLDDPPFGGPYTYEVLAFNDGGNSAKASTIAKSCNY